MVVGGWWVRIHNLVKPTSTWLWLSWVLTKIGTYLTCTKCYPVMHPWYLHNLLYYVAGLAIVLLSSMIGSYQLIFLLKQREVLYGLFLQQQALPRMAHKRSKHWATRSKATSWPVNSGVPQLTALLLASDRNNNPKVNKILSYLRTICSLIGSAAMVKPALS